MSVNSLKESSGMLTSTTWENSVRMRHTGPAEVPETGLWQGDRVQGKRLPGRTTVRAILKAGSTVRVSTVTRVAPIGAAGHP